MGHRQHRWMGRVLENAGTLVALAWALHSIVHYHDLCVGPEPPE